MIIRTVRPEDRDEWLRMRSALWPEEAREDLSAQADAYLRGDGPDASLLTQVLLCEPSPGEPRGFLELFVRNIAEGCAGPTPYIEGWYVDPEFRGLGFGRKLVEAAEAWARDHGFHELASDTQLDNEQSQSAHESLGFEEVERIVHYRKDV